jgi:hypothetical protein
MRKVLALLGGALFALVITGVSAQPRGDAATQERSVNPYVYMTDTAGDKVLLSTTFWGNDEAYDDRSLHRFFAVMAQLEKRGFKKNDQASIDWNKKSAHARCAIYLETVVPGGKGKTGTRVWCDDSGLGEFTVSPSDAKDHIETVMKRFDLHFAGAKRNAGK